MAETGSGFRGFIVELKRRRVYRVGAVYVAVAFVLLEAADLVFPALFLPDWIFRLLVVLALLGFPIALALAWAFEVTPDGVRRTEPIAARGIGRAPKMAALAAVTALVGAGSYWAFMRPSEASALVPNLVVVAPFENLTGDPSLDRLGQIVGHQVTNSLGRTGVADVVLWLAALVSFEAARAVGSPREGLAWARIFAQEAGAGLAVTGAFYQIGDSIVFLAQIIDARRGRLIHAVGPVAAPFDSLSQGYEGIAEEVMVYVASLLTPGLSEFIAVTSVPPNYQAYQEYVEGAELFSRGDWSAALTHLYRAYAIDSAFVSPLLLAATIHGNSSRFAEADSLARIVNRSRERLAPGDRAWLDYTLARVRGDHLGELEASRKLAELAPGPGSPFVYQLGVSARWVNRPEEVVETYSRLEPGRGAIKDLIELWYWWVLADAHHMLGDHRRELKEARAGRARHPESFWTISIEGRALAALGWLDELNALVDESLTVPSGSTTPALVMETAAIELRAHGHHEAVGELLDRAIDWYRNRIQQEGETRFRRYRLARNLYSAERWDEALRIFEDLAAEFPGSIEYQGYLGVLAARRGDEETALSISEGLRDLDGPYLHGFNTYWRACIASVLGDPELAIELLRSAVVREGHGFRWLPDNPKTSLHADIDLEHLRDYRPFIDLLRPKG